MNVAMIRLSVTHETLSQSRVGVLGQFRLVVRQGRGLAAIRMHLKPRQPRLIKIEIEREGPTFAVWMWFAELRHQWVKGGACGMPGCTRRWKDHTMQERIVR